MDPVSIVVAALAAGASAGLKETVADAVKDTYAALKKLIAQRYSDVSTSALEKKPDSEHQQAAVKESLTDANAGDDPQLVSAAEELLQAVTVHDPQAAATVGVDLSRVAAGSIDIHNVAAAPGATGLHAEDVKVTGAINITGVQAGAIQNDHP